MINWISVISLQPSSVSTTPHLRAQLVKDSPCCINNEQCSNYAHIIKSIYIDSNVTIKLDVSCTAWLNSCPCTSWINIPRPKYSIWEICCIWITKRTIPRNLIGRVSIIIISFPLLPISSWFCPKNIPKIKLWPSPICKLNLWMIL